MCCIMVRFHNESFQKYHTLSSSTERAKHKKHNVKFVGKRYAFMLNRAITTLKGYMLIFKPWHFLVYLQVLLDVKEFLASWAEYKIT